VTNSVNESKADKEKAKQLTAERRTQAKQLANERRAQAKNRKRKCVLCSVEENEKFPFVAHVDGIGPSCKDPMSCENNRVRR
jgi:hypothetical protein